LQRLGVGDCADELALELHEWVLLLDQLVDDGGVGREEIRAVDRSECTAPARLRLVTAVRSHRTVTMKKRYLVASDYGQGAVWLLIDAESPELIESKFPELTVVLDRPGWMTEERMRNLEETACYDLDAPLSGFLEALVAERQPGK
jgi:hypothetical protein